MGDLFRTPPCRGEIIGLILELARYYMNGSLTLIMRFILRQTGYWFCILFLIPVAADAQKFHFQNYNVQQGLIQSQVLAITQDPYDNLWFCTLGGISRFDGKTFTNYSETDGLVSNYTNSILADHQSNIWIGTAFGISRFDGRTFRNIRFSELPNGNLVRSIQEDNEHRIWVQAGNSLYRMDHNEKPLHTAVSGLYEKISVIRTDPEGHLWASVVNGGIYRLEKDGWKLRVPFPKNEQYFIPQRMVFDEADKEGVYLLCFDKLLYCRNGEIRQLIRPGQLGRIRDMYRDKSGRLWLTCKDGLYQYADSTLTAFNPENGYEGSSTSAIFQDHEQNLWFGTDGTGVFRYSYQQFLIYDQFSAAHSMGILPMLKSGKKLFLGTASGLFIMEGNEVNQAAHFSSESDRGVAGIFEGRKGEVYVLTGGGSFMKYSPQGWEKISFGEWKTCINSVYPDPDGGFWLAGCFGLVRIGADGSSNKVLDVFASKILPVENDSMLVSTDQGLYVVAHNMEYRKINDSLLSSASYMSMNQMGKYYLLATANKGFILFDRKNGKHHQLTTRNGLNSDFIYSAVSDGDRRIWLGTGRGVNRILLDTTNDAMQVSNISVPGDISSAESNQGAAVFDDDSNILWVGTVSGLFKYRTDTSRTSVYLPPVVLQQIQVGSGDIPAERYTGLKNAWYAVPENLVLKHGENHLMFSFRCPSYQHSDGILYQYQLEGMEKNWSPLTSNHSVIYPGLPPGHYVFRARAWLDGIGYTKDNVEFPFDIKAAFYQTLYFKLLLLVVLMGLILWIQWIRIRVREKRFRQIEEVKREENIKVRQTASEDFHDEVGNSLTRIQVLTDVLQTKLGGGHEEEKRIIAQIKDNISGLYQGTRDILWALNPESDVVREIGQRLESLGIDVFLDTGVYFTYRNQLGEAEKIKLPGNYNRNIMMIFKEAMSNSLRHGQPSLVQLTTGISENREIVFELSDDGVGFNPLFAKKGHGFQNMQKRANRIKAVFELHSSPGAGTRYRLRIPVSSGA